MRALILAAGRGSRMRHLTDDRPKGLVALNGESLIARQCAALRGAGATEIGIVTGYRAELLAPFAETVFHNPDWAETQMVTSLSRADRWLREAPLIVSYSDIFYTAATVTALMGATASLAISYDPDWEELWSGRFADPLEDAETFRLAADGVHLAGIGGRPRSREEVEGQYMGLLRFTPESWRSVLDLRAGLSAQTRDRLHMTGLLDLLVARGERIEAIACRGPWGEIDSVEDLAFYEGREALRS